MAANFFQKALINPFECRAARDEVLFDKAFDFV
jgi:hypothetical protein